jgi:hypothetical protein
MFDASRSVAGADGACDAGGEDRRQFGSGGERKSISNKLSSGSLFSLQRAFIWWFAARMASLMSEEPVDPCSICLDDDVEERGRLDSCSHFFW